MLIINDLQIFNNPEFGTIRTLEKNGEPWFVGKDVADILGYSNSRKAIADHVDVEDKGVTKRDTPGGTQDITIINESGLYSLILTSKLPKAKEFKRWVTSEVLPTIRKHGAYMTQDTIDQFIADPDFGIKLLSELKAEQAKRKALEAENEANRPKALFADAVSASKSSILIGDLAKLVRQNGVEIGQKRLFQWLRDNGYLIRQNGASWNMPTQRSMDLGLFEVKETTITHSDGHISISKTVKVTGKGQVYFINKLLPKPTKAVTEQ